MGNAIKTFLFLCLLVFTPGCFAKDLKERLPDSPNLVKNGSFEEGVAYWRTYLDKSDTAFFHAVRDRNYLTTVNFPYWEGKAAYHRPVHGEKYLEMRWDGLNNPKSECDSMMQEVSIPSPGKYLIVAHVKVHAGSVVEDGIELPKACITLSDSGDGSVIRRLTVDWLPARQNWIRIGAMADVKGRKINVSLGFLKGKGAASKADANLAFLFDDIRLIAAGASENDLIHLFDKSAVLTISSTGQGSQPRYEYEYAADNFTHRRLSSQKVRFPFSPDVGWEYKNSDTADVSIKPQRKGGEAIAFLATKGQTEDPAQIVRNIVLPHSEGNKGENVVLSAWVWSDIPRSAYLRIEYDGEKTAESAFHSGSGKWENLTVVAPYRITEGKLRLALRLRIGNARFRAPELLVMADDRFDGILPPQDIGGGRLRERVAYKKDSNRYRIVVVGNSTVNGVVFVSHYASFPYLLQLKLETLYPGKFEVINYGIGAGGLLDQIISVNRHFKFATQETSYYLPLVNPARYETPSSPSLIAAYQDAVSLASIKPDLIIICSMWNDLDRLFNWHVLARDYGALNEFLLLVDDPSQDTYNAYRQKKDFILKEIEKTRASLAPKNYSYAWTTDQTYIDLSRDAQFYEAARSAEQKYEELLEAFVARAVKISAVWSLALPANGGKKAADFFDHAPDLMLKADSLEKEKRKAIAFARQVHAKIQSRASEHVALKYGIQNIDLVSSYDAVIEDATAADWARLEYFIPDLIHFTYRGNQWIADEIFRLMEVKFESLAQIHH